MDKAISDFHIGLILDNVQDGVIAVDSSGLVVLFNKAAERITGLRASDVIGKLAVDAIPNTRMHIVLKTGEPEINSRQIINDTAIITCRFPIHDEKGNITGAVAVFKDVTELETLTVKVTDLWNSRELLEAVIEATDDAISVADSEGNNIIVNRAYTRITGMAKEAVIGKPATVDIAEGESMHMKVLKTGGPVRNVRMKVGPMKREVIVNVAPVKIMGRIKGSVGVIHDISELMSLNDELTKARRIIRQIKARYTWDDIISLSPEIDQAKEQAIRAASTSATVLLRGESGVGKELFAHAIHNASSRRDGQFVRVNCAAIADTLLESQLFGYESGAFTGAAKGGKKGYFEEAENGTLFLDEIGELSLALQSKLLRVLQEKEIVRVGGTSPLPVNARVIAATNVDLEMMVSKGVFREDLYYRLNVIPINIIPLRKRPSDIPIIAESLLVKLNQEYHRNISQLSQEAKTVLIGYDWPGNVRELENVLGRVMINMKPHETVIELRHMPRLAIGKAECVNQNVHPNGSIVTLDDAVEAAEIDAIKRALDSLGGNREKAAGALKVSIRNLYYKLKKYNL